MRAPSGRRLGVLGWPVAHSRSPAIHNAALRAVGLGDWRYQLLPAPPELFAEIVSELPVAGFRGANVTLPHKAAAFTLADQASAAATAIGAANTLVFEDGKVFADNTDAPALIDALPFQAEGRTALVLGAGGSARAVVWALLQARAGEVRIWNRTPERARALADELGGNAVESAAPANILVHCTSSGLDSSRDMFKGLPLGADEVSGYDCVVDLVYTDTGTELVRAARDRGVRTVDGLEILVRQGALSFERFCGVTAPVDAMHAAARSR
ncbi:MAG TPA: shikimate dehydrogenase [Solirubrobacteraceae bacterium]|jgi:shikimate dehydrogenase|nr:shikimate dehydrogenase [Solirubrobacteraceae bacterium]